MNQQSESHKECTDLFRVYREGSLALAVCAIADLDLLGCILVERTQDGTAFFAIEFDILELREHTASPGHDTGYAD